MKKFIMLLLCLSMCFTGVVTAEETHGVYEKITDFTAMGGNWTLGGTYHITEEGKVAIATTEQGKLAHGTLHFDKVPVNFTFTAKVKVQRVDEAIWQSCFMGLRIPTKGGIWDKGLWIGVREDARLCVRINGTSVEVPLPFSYTKERLQKIVDDGKTVKVYGSDDAGKEVLLSAIVTTDSSVAVYDGNGKECGTIGTVVTAYGYVGFMSHYKEGIYSEVTLQAENIVESDKLYKIIPALVGYNSVPTVGGTAVNKIFKDIDHVSWAFEGIAALNARGVVSGTTPGVFEPDGTLTKEQYIKLVAGGFELMDATAKTSFSDVPEGEWYYSYVASAEKAGLLDGIYSGKLGVGEPISREDMVTIALRALNKKGVNLRYTKEAQEFADSGNISVYAKEAVVALYRAGIVNGVTETTFEPKGTATRAAAAKVLCGLLNYIPNTNIRDTMADTWVGADALKRDFNNDVKVGKRDEEKVAGLFFYIWHEDSVKQGIYDNMKIKAVSMGEDRPWGPKSYMHYCQEPYFGYYANSDEYVIRKNMQMFADSGIDFLYLDTTNAVIYPQTLANTLKVMREMQNEGKKVPKFCFTINYNAYSSVEDVYAKVYSKNVYDDLWFYWEGKPLILAPANQIPEYIGDFFTVRQSWAYGPNFGNWWNDGTNGQNKWPWLARYPQPYGWSKSPTIPEQLVIATAEHVHTNVGKSFSNNSAPEERRTNEGLYFAEQIKRINEVKPQVLMITQWNEKIAARGTIGDDSQSRGDEGGSVGDTTFIDAYDEEYNRDIEPVKGSYGDNYYYQMVNAVRIHKGARKSPETSEKKTIAIGEDFGVWQTVSEVYYDDIYDIPHRDFKAVGNTGLRYTETSGRNDIIESRVARDDEKVYFYVKTRENITEPTDTDKSHMILYINSDGDYNTGWNGYDYMIGRARTREGDLSVEKCTASNTWQWKVVARAKYVTRGNEKHLEVAKADLGINSDSFVLDFKWGDNQPEKLQIMDFIDKGDAAPNGRFNYRFTAK